MKPTEAHLRLLVVLIAVHSAFVGVMLVFFTSWSVRFAGWPGADPHFFVHQGGVFHIVVAFGYLLEYVRHRTVTLLVTAKTCAFVFLGSEALLGGAPWVIPFSALSDGAMGLVVWWVYRMVGAAD